MKGFGFITFADTESAQKAKDELHETDVFGTGNIRVNFAKPRVERGAGDRGDRGRRGGRDQGGEPNRKLFLGGLTGDETED